MILFKNSYRNIKLGYKVIITVFVCLILPLILIFAVVNNIVGDTLKENQWNIEVETLKQSRPVIETFINDTEMISRNIISNPDVQKMLETYQSTGNIDQVSRVNINFFVRELLETRPYLSSISLYTKDNILLQSGNFYSMEDPSLLPELETRAGLSLWEYSKVQPYWIMGEDNQSVVSLQRQINHLYSFKALGFERISIDENYISTLYQPADKNDNSDIIIFNDEGKIVSASDKDHLNKEIDHTLMKKCSNGQGYFSAEDSNTIYFYYSLDKVGWTVLKISDTKSIYDNLSLTKIIIWLALMIAILFSILFSFWISRIVISPVVKLSRDVDKIDIDHLEVNLHTKNKDEIGLLNRQIIQMTNRLSDLINTIYINEINIRDSQLLALQSQINPHFLYNTLDSLRWQALEHGEASISEQIEALSNLFRHVISERQEVTSLEKEIEHLGNYLLIQENRFGDRIKVALSIDKSLLEQQVLKLVLQPIVENAFLHGLENKLEGGTVKITVCANDNNIVYVVEDDGVGSNEEEVNSIISTGKVNHRMSALKNVNDRLTVKYGIKHGIKFESRENVGTRVTVTIPKEGGQNETANSG